MIEWEIHLITADMHGHQAEIDAILSAGLVTPDISTVLELFEKPLRIVASLRK